MWWVGRRWAALRSRPVLALLVTGAVVVLAVLTALSFRSPGSGAAREVVEDYLDARIADGCGHYAYYSEAFARAEHVDVKDCQADEALAEGEYFEYDVQDVRVDGVRAEVDVEDESDAPRGPFTVALVVEGSEWRIGDIEERE